jgi:hypothetical protein
VSSYRSNGDAGAAFAQAAVKANVKSTDDALTSHTAQSITTAEIAEVQEQEQMTSGEKAAPTLDFEQEHEHEHELDLDTSVDRRYLSIENTSGSQASASEVELLSRQLGLHQLRHQPSTTAAHAAGVGAGVGAYGGGIGGVGTLPIPIVDLSRVGSNSNRGKDDIGTPLLLGYYATPGERLFFAVFVLVASITCLKLCSLASSLKLLSSLQLCLKSLNPSHPSHPPIPLIPPGGLPYGSTEFGYARRRSSSGSVAGEA